MIQPEDHVGLELISGFTQLSDLLNAEQMPRLTQRLLSKYFISEQISKILGENSLRVL
jgi:microsomal dipeptidase-like Zn-dependent dipeptidase